MVNFSNPFAFNLRLKLLAKELLFVFFLIYIGWGLGDRNRMSLRKLKDDDISDLQISALIIIICYAIMRYYIKSDLKNIQQNKYKILRKLTGLYLIVIFLMIVTYKIWYGVYWDYNILYYTTPVYWLLAVSVIIYFILPDLLRPSPMNNQESMVSQIPAYDAFGTYLLPISSIVFLVSQNKKTFAQDHKGNLYSLDEILQYWHDQLPSDQFFRANRQYIINRKYVSGFSNGLNQKLQLEWTLPGLPEVIISKSTAPRFKNWVLAVSKQAVSV